MSTPSFREVTVKSDGNGLTRCCAITSNVARDRGIILPSAVPRDLSTFQKNPSVLSNHPWLSAEPPTFSRLLGVVEEFDIEIETDDGGGKVDMLFRLSEKNPEAVLARDLISEEILRAVSIGWLTLEQVTRTSPRAEIDALPRFAREKLLARECDWVATRIELFELSLIAGAGSDRDALIQLRAMWDARQQTKEAEMAPVPPKEEPKAGDVQGDLENFARAFLRLARTGHPGLNDALSRLMGVYQSLSSGFCGYGDEPNAEPPSPDVCRASAGILREIADDVEGFAGPPEPQAAAAPTTDASSRAGKAVSKANQEKIRAAVSSCEAHAECVRALADMLDEIDEDAAEDDGDDAGTDADRAAAIEDAVKRAIQATQSETAE